MKRRTALKLLSGGGLYLASGCRTAGTPPPPVDLMAESDDILREEALANGWDPAKFSDVAGDRSIILNDAWKYWDYPQDLKPQVGWAPDATSADYSFLSGLSAAPGTAFRLTSADLALLAERNHFNFREDADRVVVGLRGCMTADGALDTGWVTGASLVTARPDHKTMRCLIGVWDRVNEQVRFFSASTVPEKDYMLEQVKKSQGANLLPTGLYAYRVGSHSLSSQKRRQIGALRLSGFYNPNTAKPSDGAVIVLRSLDNLVIDPSDPYEVWDRCLPYDNIHASIYWEGASWADAFISRSNAHFSSAGCQVIRGGYRLVGERKYSGEPIEQWGEFRRALGMSELTAESVEPLPEYDTVYHYMLLTGDDAEIVANGKASAGSGYEFVRYGSSGEGASAVQEAYGLGVDGVIGPVSLETILRMQTEAQAPTQVPVVRLA